VRASTPVRFGPFAFDPERRQLFGPSGEVHLTPKAFDLLHTLIAAGGRPIAKDDLMRRLWPDTAVVEASLTVLIAELRRALGDNPRDPRFVRTVHRVGYAFCGDDRELPAAAPGAKVASRWCLVWEDKRFALTEGENLVGRHPDCAVWLDLSGISRRHARIIVEADQARLEDLDSLNHTYVGSRRVTEPTPIRDGDLIRFGTTVQMRFRLWDVKTTTIGRPGT
jgi:DNA-binding winged helix-turn-helix (wHTH) protein